MLPDIPDLKRDIAKALNDALKARVNAYMGAINECPRHFIKEGVRVITIRPDGHIDETEMKEASGETLIANAEVPYLSFSDRLRKLDGMARDMAQQISRHAFGQINEAVEKVGNVVDSGKRGLTPEAYLDVIRKIQLDFDEHGRPSELTLVIPPDLEEQARQTLATLHEDVKYRALFEELISEKKREWRDREAARKLVG